MHAYDLALREDMHDILMKYFSSLNFPESEVEKLDVVFSEMAGGWMYIHNGNIKVHFFITPNNVKMIIESDMDQAALSLTMKDYFVFPK